MVAGGAAAFVRTHSTPNYVGVYNGRVTFTVIDTVPVSGASLSPGNCAFNGACAPPLMSVTVDDSTLTVVTVTPHG